MIVMIYFTAVDMVDKLKEGQQAADQLLWVLYCYGWCGGRGWWDVCGGCAECEYDQDRARGPF